MPAATNRPRFLVLAAMGSALVLVAVNLVRWLPPDPLVASKVRAAQIMREGLVVLGDERTRRGLPPDAATDPNRTGLIGRDYTDLTTTLGSLVAKRTSTNPNFAGVVVALLDRAGVKKGDPVAVTFSGSFPALNLAVLAAARAMELRPVIVSSVGASSYGANEPDWTWLDMERLLAEKGVIVHRSAWAALGGIVAEGGGLDGTGLERGRAAILRTGVRLLDEGAGENLERDASRRMDLYRDACGGRPAAFVNVGGALTALGAVREAPVFPPGLITATDHTDDPRRGLIVRMVEQGVPVIHLLDIRHLAEKYGLPIDPVPLPTVPAGAVMKPGRHARSCAWGGLLAVALLLVWADRRIRQAARAETAAQPGRA